MSVFLPVAGISINIFVLVGAGAGVGFLSGLLGVGGGFLLTPILIMIGIPPTVAAASDSCQIVAASASGTAAHFRLGNVDYRMGAVLLLGGLTGAAIGVHVVKVFRMLGNADLLITLTYIVVLGAVGGFMFVNSLQALRGGAVARKPKRHEVRTPILSRLPFQIDFPHSGVRHSIFVPFTLCALVGILAAIMGVGGGFLMVPMMVYLLRMPAHKAVGTDLFQILFTCAAVTYLQATTNFTVDVVLALLLAAGSTIGAQIGARVSRLLKGEQLLIILASLALAVVVRMTVSIVTTPSSLLAPAAHARLEPAPAPAGPVNAMNVPGAWFLPLLSAAQLPPGIVETPPEPNPVSISLEPQQIHIDMSYGGAQIRVQGEAGAGSQVVVVARGPEGEETFNRKVRMGPIWVSSGKVHVSQAPALFLAFTPEPLERILDAGVIRKYELSEAAVMDGVAIDGGSDPADADLLRRHYLAMKRSRGAYRTVTGSVAIEQTGGARAAYSVDIDWPKTAPPGQYRFVAYECRDRQVVNETSATLELVKVGVPAQIYALAMENPAVYGILSVLLAMAAGFAMDVLAQRFIGKKKKHLR